MGVVLWCGFVFGGLGPGEVGFWGGFGKGGAVVEVAGEEEVGGWCEEAGHWGDGVDFGR